VLAFIISKLTGAKFIVEVIGNHAKSFKFASDEVGFAERIKYYLTMCVTPFILNQSHGVKLLYQDQVKSFKGLNHLEKYVWFHDFVPIGLFKGKRGRSKYILFVGGPWFLKGVDILIKAFKKVSDEFPDYRLKIIGWSPDRAYFNQLAEGYSKIELCGPARYEEVIKLMAECSLFILPSRTEAMGCVLLEAMASRKPIIASNIDGIPTYIKNGYNGLLFEPENIDDLAGRMRMFLQDENYANQMAENGYTYVHEFLSEKHYLSNFTRMIDKVIENNI
jgi:glycosyltransferase involved in cell wall biosynthesis